MKRKVILILIGISLLFSSCDNKNTDVKQTESSNIKEDITENKEEVITINVIDQFGSYSGEQEGWFAEYLLKEKNIKLNIIPGIPINNDHKAISDYDLLILSDFNMYKEAIKEGYIKSWDDNDYLSKYGSYIEKNMESNISYNRTISKDGKLYGISTSYSKEDEPDEFYYTWNLRWDLYKEAGYPVVTNLDEYINALSKMKEIAGVDKNGEDVYALCPVTEYDHELVYLVSALVSAYYGYEQFGLGFYNSEDGEFLDALDCENKEKNSPYIEMIKYLNKMNTQGLLMPYSDKMTYDVFQEKVLNDGIISTITNVGSVEYNNEENIKEGKIFKPLIPTDARPNNIKTNSGIYDGARSKYYVIGANCKNPEKVIEFIDFMSKPENMLTAMYGPKGVTWDYDDGNTCFTDFGEMVCFDYSLGEKSEMPEPYSGTYVRGIPQLTALPWSYVSINPETNGDRYFYQYWLKYRSSNIEDIEKDWMEYTGMNNNDEYMRNSNYLFTSASQYDYSPMHKASQYVTSWNEVSEIIINKTYEAIYSGSEEECEETIKEMIDDAYDNGYDKCLEFCLEQASVRKECEEEDK